MRTLLLSFLFATPIAIYFSFQPFIVNMTWPLWAEQIAFVLCTVFIFVVICLTYFNFYALIEFSITFRILYHFLHAPDFRMNIEELHRQYPFDEVLQRKINNTKAAGMIHLDENPSGETLIIPTPSSIRMGSFFHFVKHFLRWGDGG